MALLLVAWRDSKLKQVRFGTAGRERARRWLPHPAQRGRSSPSVIRRMRLNMRLCAQSLLRTSAAHLSKGEDFDAGLARQGPDLFVDEL
jgi:hypothetical protein